jgi:hypothetical protein
MMKTSMLKCALWLCLVGVLAHPAHADADSLGTFQLGAGWATFGFSAPAGAVPAGQRVSFVGLPTQTDLKTTWPDGSLRFAVVTARVTAAGGYALNVGTPAPGSFSPVWPSGNVRFVIAGTRYTAAIPSFTDAEPWLEGALVRERRVVVVPRRDTDGAAHPLLQVIFDIRSYSDGTHRVDVCVQNVRDVSEMDLINYDVSATIGTTAVFAKAGVTHYSYTRWRKTFAVGMTESSIVPDLEPSFQARAFPRYVATVANTVYDTSSPAFDIMGFGNMDPYQPAPGGRPEIAPFPAWAAEYFVHRSPSQRAVTLKDGDLSGSWSHFITKDDGRSLIKVDESPYFWTDPRSDVGYRPKAPVVPYPDLGTTAFRGIRDVVMPSLARTDNQHFTNLIYTPYLLTGDRFYLDQLKLWANNMVLKSWPAQGVQVRGFDVSRTGGVMVYEWGYGAPRGWAWPLREVINAAVACPDSDPDKPYFQWIVRNNLDWSRDYNARSENPGVSGVAEWEANDRTTNDRIVVALWQAAYLAWAIDWAEQQGFALGPAEQFRNRMISSQINFLTHAVDGYNPEFGLPYYVQVGTKVGGVPIMFTTWAQVWSANQTNPDWLPSGGHVPPLINGYYGPDTRLMLLLGMRHNLPGATAAMNWLLSYRDANGLGILMDTSSNRQGFALAGSGTPPTVPPNFRFVP